MPSTTSKPTARIDWSKATQSSIMMYQDMVSDRLSAPPISNVPSLSALLILVYLMIMRATLFLPYWIVLSAAFLGSHHPHGEFMARTTML